MIRLPAPFLLLGLVAAAGPSAAQQADAPAPPPAREAAAEAAAGTEAAGTEAAGTEAPAAESGAETAPVDASAPAEKSETQAAAEATQARSEVVEAVGLDARVRRLSDDIGLAIKRLPGDHRLERFAVMPFEQVGAEAKSRQLGVVVADLVLTNLARDHRLPMTERSQLRQVLTEKSIAEMGITQETEAIDVGQIMQARALVIGQVADVGKSFKVQVRVLDTSSARVVHADEVDLPKEELIAVSTNAVVLRTKTDALFRSAVAPGWGQVYNGEPVKAGLVGGTVGGLAAMTLASGLATGGLYLLYNSASPENNYWGALFFNNNVDKQAQDQQLGTLLLASNVALYATAGLAALTVLAWGSGAAEAYASGTDVDSLDEALVRQ
jgi:TolB-like protein